MLRVLLAVAMTAALLAVSMPAVDTARIEHSNGRIATELTHVETTAAELAARNDPPPPGTDGARRELTLRLPEATVGSAGVERLVVRPATGTRPAVFEWRVADGTAQVRHVTDTTLHVSEPLRFHEGGRHRIVLVHQHDNTVRVERRYLNRKTEPDPP